MSGRTTEVGPGQGPREESGGWPRPGVPAVSGWPSPSPDREPGPELFLGGGPPVDGGSGVLLQPPLYRCRRGS